jgi:hypothetical protein
MHTHLKCLSLGVASFLTTFELGQVYFAESLDFPLILQLPPPDIANYDFARTVASARGGATDNGQIRCSAARSLFWAERWQSMRQCWNCCLSQLR